MIPLDIHVSLQGIVLAAGALSALGAMIAIFVKAVHFFDRQKAQDKEIKANREEFRQALGELSKKHEADMQGVNAELGLLVYGNLACLKGLSQLGCNGPVTKTIDKMERHINIKAHNIKEE